MWSANVQGQESRRASVFTYDFESAYMAVRRQRPEASDEEILDQLYREILHQRSDWCRAFFARRGARYQNCRLSNFEVGKDGQEEALQVIMWYAKNMADHVTRGRGLILFGPRGSGKDHIASALATAAIMHHAFDVDWVNGMELFGRVRDSFDGKEDEADIVRDFVRRQILYLSDPLPPSGSLTEFQATFLFRILDQRYSQMKPTWVTVNVASATELDSRIGAQNGDRLRHEALAVFCNWPSYRKVMSPEIRNAC